MHEVTELLLHRASTVSGCTGELGTSDFSSPRAVNCDVQFDVETDVLELIFRRQMGKFAPPPIGQFPRTTGRSPQTARPPLEAACAGSPPTASPAWAVVAPVSFAHEVAHLCPTPRR